jgi:predicted Rossmann fold nucleotide-binding protein DprA/Smf involved in DNA uptake
MSGTIKGMSSSEDVVRLLALTSRAITSETKPLSAADTWPLIHAGALDPNTAVTDIPDLATKPAVAERVASLLERRTQAALLLEQWEHDGIWVLAGTSEDYPNQLSQQLADKAPVLLTGVGPVELLSSAMLGVVGSRSLTAAGTDVAQAAGQWAAEHGITLCSGGARGADRESMNGSAQAGGSVVAVLADSLSRATQGSAVRQLIRDERACLITPYHPDAGFSTGNAMGRNKIIYGLSDQVLVVATDEETGGTWAGATEAIKKGYGAVRVWTGAGAGPGNDALLQIGGSAINTVEQLAEPGEASPTASQASQIELL